MVCIIARNLLFLNIRQKKLTVRYIKLIWLLQNKNLQQPLILYKFIDPYNSTSHSGLYPLINLNCPFLIFSYLNKSVFIIVKINFITIRNNINNHIKSLAISPSYIIFRNIMTTLTHSVSYTRKTFFSTA